MFYKSEQKKGGFTQHHFPKWENSSGFTLIELLVTSAIFLLITGIAMVKNSEFNSNITLTNLAYEIALQVREAQTYGVSVREFGVGTGKFDRGYGVFFSDATPDSFIFFADDDKDREYDSGGAEYVDQLSITGSNAISRFCATPTSGSEVCSDVGQIDELTVIFERPKPDALIFTNLSDTYASAYVRVRAPDGKTRDITISSTGQIGIE